MANYNMNSWSSMGSAPMHPPSTATCTPLSMLSVLSSEVERQEPGQAERRAIDHGNKTETMKGVSANDIDLSAGSCLVCKLRTLVECLDGRTSAHP